MNSDFLSSFKTGDLPEFTGCDDGRVHSDVFALADAFLSIEPMTHKKLQKLCYYAKAWYLALYDTNLISEHFEAWVHGAVQLDLYRKYRSYGFQEIPMFTGDLSKIPEVFLDFSREIFESYGQLSGYELEQLNHTEDPWVKARAGLKPWQGCSRIISEEDMKSYYRGKLSND